MRLFPILVLAAGLAAAGATAGCFGNDDEGDADPTPSPTPTGTPTATPTTTPTPTATPTDGTGGNGTDETPPPAPMQAGSGSADFSNPAATPAAAPVTIPAGYTKGNLTVTWSGTAPVGAYEPITVTFTDSAGATLVCSIPQGAISPATPAPAPCTQEGPIAPGDGQVSFSGAGTIKADWVVSVSA